MAADEDALLGLLRACLEQLSSRGRREPENVAGGICDIDRLHLAKTETKALHASVEEQGENDRHILNCTPDVKQTPSSALLQTHSLPPPLRSSFYSDHNVFSSQVPAMEPTPALFAATKRTKLSQLTTISASDKPPVSSGTLPTQPTQLDDLFDVLNNSTAELRNLMRSYVMQHNQTKEQFGSVAKKLTAAFPFVIRELKQTMQQWRDECELFDGNIVVLKEIALGLLSDFAVLHAVHSQSHQRLTAVFETASSLLTFAHKEFERWDVHMTHSQAHFLQDLREVQSLTILQCQLQILDRLRSLEQQQSNGLIQEPSDLPMIESAIQAVSVIKHAFVDRNRALCLRIQALRARLMEQEASHRQRLLSLQHEMTRERDVLIARELSTREENVLLQQQLLELRQENSLLRQDLLALQTFKDQESAVEEAQRPSDIKETIAATISTVQTKRLESVVLAFAGFNNNNQSFMDIKRSCEDLGCQLLLESTQFSPRITHLMRPSEDYLSVRVLAAFLSCKHVVTPEWLKDGNNNAHRRHHKQSPVQGWSLWYDPSKLDLRRLQPRMDQGTLHNLLVDLGKARSVVATPKSLDGVEITGSGGPTGGSNQLSWPQLIKLIASPPPV